MMRGLLFAGLAALAACAAGPLPKAPEQVPAPCCTITLPLPDWQIVARGLGSATGVSAYDASRLMQDMQRAIQAQLPKRAKP